MADTESETYTIDELAAHTRVPSRTIRFYQSKGALMAPEIRGRVAHYGPEHIARIELIGQLKDRGLRIRAIRDLVARIDEGGFEVSEWLGLEATLKSSWSDDQPEVLTEDALRERLGGVPSGAIAELVRLHLLERQGESFLVPSPGLLSVVQRLDAAGVDYAVGVKAGKILRKHATKMTRELIEHFFDSTGDGFGREPTVEGLDRAFHALRPLGLEALSLIFGHEMELVLRELVESGRAVKAASRSVQARKSRPPTTK